MNVRHQWLLIAALCALLLPSLARSQDSAWKQKYDEGKAALNSRNFIAGEQALSEAMNIARSFGKDDIRYADTCNLLALDYTGREQYPDAETFFQRALDSYQRVKGMNDPVIAMEWNNLAALYALAGKAEHAEPLYLRALALLEKRFGKEAELVVDLDALAEYYSDAQPPRTDEAIKYAKRSLPIITKTWGDDSPRLMSCLKVLGEGYCEQQKYSEAEPLLRRLVTITETASGKMSTDLIWPLETLSTVCAKQHNYSGTSGAEQAMLSALAIRVATMPAQTSTDAHKNAAQAALYKTALLEYCAKLNELGLFYLKDKDTTHYADAENDFQTALRYRQDMLGANDPLIAEVMNSLGELYIAQNRDADALHNLQSALAIRTQQDPGGKETATSMCSLAVLYFKQNDYVNAEKMYQGALDIRKKVLGEDDPEVGSVIGGLAVLNLVQNKYTDAEPLFKNAIAILNKRPELNAPALINCLDNYARLLEKTDRRTESVELLTRARELRQKMDDAQQTPVAPQTPAAPQTL